MSALAQNLQYPAGKPQLAFAGLVCVGVDAERDGLRHVGSFRQLLPQQFRRVDLGKNFAFEIQPRRESEITVSGARETVNATVLAAAVRIQRDTERHIRRLVAAED